MSDKPSGFGWAHQASTSIQPSSFLFLHFLLSSLTAAADASSAPSQKKKKEEGWNKVPPPSSPFLTPPSPSHFLFTARVPTRTQPSTHSPISFRIPLEPRSWSAFAAANPNSPQRPRRADGGPERRRRGKRRPSFFSSFPRAVILFPSF